MLFLMQQRVLSTRNPDDFSQAFITDYNLALLKAMIIAAGGEVIDIPHEVHTNPSGRITENGQYVRTAKRPSRFVRDPAVILPDKKLVISPQGYMVGDSTDIKNAIPEGLSYRAISVPNTYFEGGNVIYLPKHNLLLHGVNPVGFYPTCRVNARDEIHYRVSPQKTTEKLADALKTHGVDVMGVEFNTDDIHRQYQAENYYHLDCFMQALPDGRLVVTNKELTSPRSRQQIKKVLGEEFSDLAYPDYERNPIFLNFIAVASDQKIVVISTSLPSTIIQSLTDLSLTVVTPNTLDSEHPAYDASYCSKVVMALKDEGFESASADRLTTSVPTNVKGYLLDDGHFLMPEDAENLLDEHQNIGEDQITLCYGSGGPHCLTVEIAHTYY